MRITRWLTVAACAALLGTASAPAQTPIKNRQQAQRARIARGVESGELTRPESRRLRRNERRIHRSIVNDRRDGGGFTRPERAKARKRLNQQSRAIRRQAHDNQTR